jgi:hypothetical protein
MNKTFFNERGIYMKFKKLMGCLLPVAVLLMIFSPVAYGDLYWESVVTSGGVPEGLPKGLPEQVKQQMMAQFKDKQETVKNYLSSHGSRIDTKEDITIILFDDMTLYQLDPSTMTYVKIKMSEMEESMGPLAKEMSEDAKVTATGETKTINGFKCEKYIMTVMGVENEQWLSRDVTGYSEYEKISKKIMRDSPQFKKMGLSGDLSGKGFPVRAVTSVMGMTTTTTLQKIEKTSLSKDLFKVPAGYVQKPLNLPLHK